MYSHSALVAHAALVELGAREEHALGVDVGDVDDEARRRCPDVEVVRGVGRIGDELAVVEYGNHDRDVGGMAGPVVGVVVDDHVALVPDPALQGVPNPFEIARQRANVERRRLRLAQGVELGVEEPGAQVLGLADDRGEGHPVEDVAHLLRDGVERPADHLQGDGIDLLTRHEGLSRRLRRRAE